MKPLLIGSISFSTSSTVVESIQRISQHTRVQEKWLIYGEHRWDQDATNRTLDDRLFPEADHPGGKQIKH